MWDNPRLLNTAANALIGLAALIFAYAALQLLLRSPLFPLHEIVVRGELKHANREEIASTMDGVGGNFFATDLAAVRERLEQVAWVRRVDLRRVWPDRLEVTLEEHVAFARWGQGVGDLQSRGLVNTFGEPFSAPMNDGGELKLPLFAGPAGSEGDIARRYRIFAGLLAPLGELPERVVLTPRYAWQLRLAGAQNGVLHLELGRDGAEAVEQRLARFIAAYPESLGRLPRRAVAEHGFVDLRYPNGFALRVAGWKG
ncbi:MAG: FtsQ-type POTRA domain-containing protein [Betaproteobacteria bacterium]|nr:FtsQ-type POTRA domain-containing protein [Betaproteobacteria bacterium]